MFDAALLARSGDTFVHGCVRLTGCWASVITGLDYWTAPLDSNFKSTLLGQNRAASAVLLLPRGSL